MCLGTRGFETRSQAPAGDRISPKLRFARVPDRSERWRGGPDIALDVWVTKEQEVFAM